VSDSVEKPDLGAFVERYAPNPLTQSLGGILGILCFLLSAWAFFKGAGFAVSLLLGGVGLLCFAGRMAYQRWMPLRVLLYEDGFVHIKGRLVQTFRWDEIESVFLTEIEHRHRNGQSTYSHLFRIRTWGGVREIQFLDGDLRDGEDFGRTIMREVQRVKLKGLLKKAMQCEAAGKWNEAVAAFEQVERDSPYNEIGKQAREHIERLRQQGTAPRPDNTGTTDIQL
jgi:hypothetical protein